MNKLIIYFFILTAAVCSCSSSKVRHYKLEVVAEYPHNTDSYTQGLFFWKGRMFESAGQYGKSKLMEVDLTTGKAVRKQTFGKDYFLEGSVVFNDSLYLLTWQNKVAFIYNPENLSYQSSWSYPREGWGITTDGKCLIASDGSSRLYFMDKDWTLIKRISVKCNGKPVRWLNELEYIDGKIWANVYTSDEIVIIDPRDGEVEAVIDCSGLLAKKYYTEDTDVLNGIAYDSESGKIYLTGKNWPKLFEVKLVKK